MEYYAIVPSDLKHHGVLGQKWGVRRYQNEDGSLKSGVKSTSGHTSGSSMQSAKQAYKQAKSEARSAGREYSKSFNKAKNYSIRHLVSQHIPITKQYKRSNENWSNARDKAKISASKDAAKKEAKQAYKQAKKDYKNDIKSTYKDLKKKSSIKDKVLYNDATRKKAAKLIANGMDENTAVSKAKREALVNTVCIVVAANIAAYSANK